MSPWRGVLVDPPPPGSERMVCWLRFGRCEARVSRRWLATCSQCHLLQLFGKVNVYRESSQRQRAAAGKCAELSRGELAKMEKKKTRTKQSDFLQKYRSYTFFYLFLSQKTNFSPKNDLFHSISWLLCILAIKKCLHSGIPSNQLDLNPNGWVILSLYICWVTLVVIKTASFHGHSWNFRKAGIFSFSLHPSDLFAI